MKSIRTRIAPSPTGDDIHIGNLYTALINFAIAKQHKGKFIIRIEDTDRTRFREGAEDKILSSVKAFGLPYDEGPDIGGPFAPYRQSERLPLYKKYAEELIEKGAAYYCFCTRERLDALRAQQTKEKKNPRYDKHCLNSVKNAAERIKNGESYVVRLNILPNKKMWFKDVVRGKITIDSNEVDDQVLLKSDGFPTYHLGVVVDDHIMEISHIIRAEEWISSTPKHILLYESFGWEVPVFAHLPILRNPDKSKLSKRKNPVWASWYLDEGFLPEAVLNYLALLGWSHPEEKEFFTLDEFIEKFELEDLKPVGPVFDLIKLKWMNGEYIRRLSADELISKLKSQSSKLQIKTQNLHDELLKKLVPLAQSRMQTLNEFFEQTKHFFEEPEITLSDQEKNIAKNLYLSFTEVSDWNKDVIFQSLKKVMDTEKIRMPVLYKIITGNERGLPLPESLEILGKDATVARLSHYV